MPLENRQRNCNAMRGDDLLMVGLPFTSDSAAPAVREPKLKITTQAGAPTGGIGGFASDLADAAANLLGMTAPDPWPQHLLDLQLHCALAPHVDYLQLNLVDCDTTPKLALSDKITVALGYDGATPEDIFTGEVARLQRNVHGVLRVIAVGSLAKLAWNVTNASYEKQKAGDIVRALSGEAGLAPGKIDTGADYPFYVIDDRRNTLTQIAELARGNGFYCYTTPKGEFQFHTVQAANAVALRYGADIVAMNAYTQNANRKGVKVVGEGAAPSQGSEASSWLVKNPQASAEEGDEPRVVIAVAAAKDMAATSAAAKAQLARWQQYNQHVQLRATLTPSIAVGSTFSVNDAPDSAANGDYIAIDVKHSFDRQRGYTSEFIGVRAGGGGAGLGSLF
jgi:phage protein D